MRAYGFTKGLITGAMVGAVMGIMFDPLHDKDRKRMKRNTQKYLKTAGNMMDSMMYFRH